MLKSISKYFLNLKTSRINIQYIEYFANFTRILLRKSCKEEFQPAHLGELHLK